MGVDHHERDVWLQQLTDIWPDVSNGDTITCYVDKKGHAFFYLNGEKIGEIQSQEFQKYFLAIWLSEQSRDLSLRKSLIGGT